MQALIVGSIFTVLEIWMIVSRVRLKRRPVQEGIDDVVRYLNSPRQNNLSEVVLKDALPLSDHMVKDIANTRGYRYMSETSRYSNDTLLFAPGDGKRKRKTAND